MSRAATAQKRSTIQSELLDLFTKAEKIEKKYQDGIIADETDQKAMQDLMAEIETKEKELEPLVQADERAAAIELGLGKYGRPAGTGDTGQATQRAMERKTLGQLFVESEGYLEAKESGALDGRKVPDFGTTINGVSLLDILEEKSLLYTGQAGTGIDVGEPFQSITRRPGIMEILRPALTFLDMVPRVGTDEEQIEWVKEKTFTNNAAMIDEASATSGTSGIKPQSTMDFEVDSTGVKDMAHWMAVTNKMLRNAAQIRGMINQKLLLGLDQLIEDQILNGDGTGNNLLGLLEAGIQIRAQGSDTMHDAIYRAITMVRVTGLSNPNLIAMNPLDWEIIRLTRDDSGGAGTGGYLWGSPALAGAETLWGMPVRLTHSLPAGTAVVLTTSQMTLFDRMRSKITTGLINDFFIRNLQVILAEAALAFVVWRPNAFCQVTGLSA